MFVSLENKEETVLDPTCFHFSLCAKTFGKKLESHKGTSLLFLTYRLPLHTVFYNYKYQKKGHLLILLSKLTRYSLEPKLK